MNNESVHCTILILLGRSKFNCDNYIIKHPCEMFILDENKERSLRGWKLKIRTSNLLFQINENI